jgi:hypothetical protein
MMASAYGQSDVREAVRWEHAKERAAARQAAIERRAGSKAREAKATPEQAGAPAQQSALREAISYEQFKESAAARQARIEASGEKSQRTVTASGRR